MKNAIFKRRRDRLRQTASIQPVKPKSGRPWFVLILCLLLSATATWAACEYVFLSRIPAELAGKWVVTDGKQEGATFDFYRNGSMVAVMNNDGKEAILRAGVRVEEDKLFVTTRNPGGENETRVQTIKTLTAKTLVLIDNQGQEWKLNRAE